MTSPSHRRAAGAHRALLGSAFILVSGAAQAALLADDFEDGVVRYTTTGVAGAVTTTPSGSDASSAAVRISAKTAMLRTPPEPAP